MPSRSGRRLIILLAIPSLYLLHLLLSAIYATPAPKISSLDKSNSLLNKDSLCPPCPACPAPNGALRSSSSQNHSDDDDDDDEDEEYDERNVPVRHSGVGQRPDVGPRPDMSNSVSGSTSGGGSGSGSNDGRWRDTGYDDAEGSDPRRKTLPAEGIETATEVVEVSAHGDVVNVTQTKPAYAHFAAPTEAGRASDVIDTFKNYKHADECGVSSLDLHLPFSPLCPDKQSLLAAMTGGGRAGYDTPFIPMGCDMRWYDTPEICTILSRFSRVFVIGDSLQRHVLNSLYMMLRRDVGYGGITNWDFKPDEHANVTKIEDCKCSLQITRHACSDQAIWNSDWVWGNASDSMACDRSEMPIITYHRFLGYPIPEEQLTSLSDSLEKTQPEKPWVFFMHHELWNDVKIEDSRAWLDQIMDHFKHNFPWLQTISNFPRLYVTANAGGRNKGLGFMVNQNNQALANFELGMMPRVAMMAVDFLGFFNMSIQSTQWDGAHTTMESNFIKTQMLLNWLDRTGKEINYIMQ